MTNVITTTVHLLILFAFAATVHGNRQSSESLKNSDQIVVDFVPKGPGRQPSLPSLQPLTPATTSNPSPAIPVPAETTTQAEDNNPATDEIPAPAEDSSTPSEDASIGESAVSEEKPTTTEHEEQATQSPIATPTDPVMDADASPVPNAAVESSPHATVEEEKGEVNDDTNTSKDDSSDTGVELEKAPGSGQGYYPCHPDKGFVDTSVTCTRVEIPKLLCKRCALRPTVSDGQFGQCDNIFDVETDDCKEAMTEYVDSNGHCDPVRADVVPRWIDGDSNARKSVDYFLYSVCELCCDCVPMGVAKTDFSSLKKEHSRSKPTLWEAERGNCPAHAHFDLCKVLPQVQYLTKVGGEEENHAPACGPLENWLNSERSQDWQRDPKTDIEGSTKTFLDGALDALMCHRSFIWKKCFDMEAKQKHLGGGSMPDASTFEEGSDNGESSNISGQESAATGSRDREEQAVEVGSSNSCFPGSATVELESGAFVRMEEVVVGSRVRVSASAFSDVYMFSHRDGEAADEYYLKIATSETSVTLTAGHFLYVMRKGGGVERQAVAADQVQVGDELQSSTGRWMAVVSISKVSGRGLYNPQTIGGDICVDGVVTSTFTRAVRSGTAVALLTPVRAMYQAGLVGEAQMGWFLARGAGTYGSRVLRGLPS